MVSLDFFKNRWWSTLVTAAPIGILFFFVFPSLALIALNSRSAMLAMIALGCVCFPWLISRLHGVSPILPAIAFYVIVAAGWLLQPAHFDGNPKLALATFMTPWLLAALLINAAVNSFLLYKNASK